MTETRVSKRETAQTGLWPDLLIPNQEKIMKLTKNDHDTIIRGIKADMPEIDDKEAIQTALVKAMSPTCRKLYKVTPRALATHYQNSSGVFLGGFYSHDFVKGDADADAVLEPFKAKKNAREAALRAARTAVAGCNTVKQLTERYPEFAKYAPMQLAKGTFALVVTDPIPALKNEGWPTTKKPK